MRFRKPIVTFLALVLAGSCCVMLALFAERIQQTSRPAATVPNAVDPIVDGRIVDIFLYPIFHHHSIVVEDKIIGHCGYNMLSDVDDPDGFYRKKFSQGLPQELSIINSYWASHRGSR